MRQHGFIRRHQDDTPGGAGVSKVRDSTVHVHAHAHVHVHVHVHVVHAEVHAHVHVYADMHTYPLGSTECTDNIRVCCY